MNAGYGCASDFGSAAGDHVPASLLALRFSMDRRRFRSSRPCVLRSPQYVFLLSIAF